MYIFYYCPRGCDGPADVRTLRGCVATLDYFPDMPLRPNESVWMVPGTVKP